jgi:hypothetical protein
VQLGHVHAFAREYVPAWHIRHCDDALPGANVPGEQSMQELAWACENSPGLQYRHADAISSENDPATHTLQADASTPENWPVKHVEHALAPVSE